MKNPFSDTQIQQLKEAYTGAPAYASLTSERQTQIKDMFGKQPDNVLKQLAAADIPLVSEVATSHLAARKAANRKARALLNEGKRALAELQMKA